jgi:23S rRNA pseudouridine2605 synthase
LSVRLNKLLAERGVGARRKCDLLIQEGRVRVNGEVVREPGTQVEPGRDRIEVAGRRLPPPAPRRYFVLNKPVGVITTLEDPEGRRTVRDFMPGGGRLFPVGRLDADTSGLLILTNDGELAHHLMHPRYGVEKVYRAWVGSAPSPGQIARLRRGVEFEPGIVSEPARVRVARVENGRGLVEIVVHEGRYRQVRRMLEAVGLDVHALHRAAYGPLTLGALERGMWRELSEGEVERLRAASSRPHARRGPAAEYFSARRGLVRTGRERGPRPDERSPDREPPAGASWRRPGERLPRPRARREAGRERTAWRAPEDRDRGARPRREAGGERPGGRPAWRPPEDRERGARPRREAGGERPGGRPAWRTPEYRERGARPRRESGGERGGARSAARPGAEAEGRRRWERGAGRPERVGSRGPGRFGDTAGRRPEPGPTGRRGPRRGAAPLPAGGARGARAGRAPGRGSRPMSARPNAGDRSRDRGRRPRGG